MRVLLVDDEADLASALAERLEMRGIEADWVTTGQEALDRVATRQYDLAVLDVRMPKMGGGEVRDQLQARCPNMKFIFLTGYGSEIDFKEISNRSGEASYLVKPIDIQDLIQRMNELLKPQGEGQ
ncbi:MAG: response regulator [Desulfobacteraceae bacterium]|nr:response regulator [Desulfobacteraceae bacterium]